MAYAFDVLVKVLKTGEMVLGKDNELFYGVELANGSPVGSGLGYTWRANCKSHYSRLQIRHVS